MSDWILHTSGLMIPDSALKSYGESWPMRRHLHAVMKTRQKENQVIENSASDVRTVLSKKSVGKTPTTVKDSGNSSTAEDPSG